VLAVKAPGYGDRKKEYLQDIAVVTGGTVISEEVGLKFEKVELSMLGKASRVTAKKDKTTIVGGKGKREAIQSRIAELTRAIENTDSKFDREKLEERVAKLSGGVAVIRVGAATETEMKYLKLKIEDAVNATKAAIEEGIVPGGGTALVRVAKTLRTAFDKSQEKKSQHDLVNFEFASGYAIVLDALTSPLRQIAHNAGKDGAAIVHEVMQARGSAGYDAANDKMVDDMVKAGIIDPVKVTRSCVQNATSAAAILLTTEAAVAEEPEEKKPASGGGPGMGGMDMDY
jgi:chaperonin GroEL